MVNLDIEVLVNGRKIRMSEKLGDLISNYLIEKIGGLEDTPILDNTPPKVKYKPAKVYGDEDKKLPRWTEEETLKFCIRVEEVRKTGLSFTKVCEKLSPEFGDRSAVALYQKLSKLRTDGILKVL